MKKFLAALLSVAVVTAVGFFIFTSDFVKPASNFVAPGPSADAKILSCGDLRTKSSDWGIGVDAPPGSGQNNSFYDIDVAMKFRYCENNGDPHSARVYGYRVTINRTSGPSCGHTPTSNYIDDWRVNPNVLGTWNPGEKEKECEASLVFTWGIWDNITLSSPTVTWVFPSTPSNERCLGSHVTAVFGAYPDTTGDTPSLCLYNG